jgi:hypothetical protein
MVPATSRVGGQSRAKGRVSPWMSGWGPETGATLQARQDEVNNINNPRPSGNRR